MISLIFIFILFFIMIYFLLLLDDTQYENNKKDGNKDDNKETNYDTFVYLISRNGYYISINDITGGLYLNNDITKAEIFKIVKGNRNKIGLQSTTLGHYLMINYTSFYNYEYDINLQGVSLENNATQLKLIKNKKNKNYYIKFYNNYYLCIDINGNLFSCKDKSKVLYFKFEKI